MSSFWGQGIKRVRSGLANFGRNVTGLGVTDLLKQLGDSRIMKKSIDFYRNLSPWLAILSVVGLTALATPAYANHGAGGGATYSFLDAGFTQDLVGTSAHFAGDVTVASDGDVFLSDCQGSGSELHRYDLQGADPIINGTMATR